MGWQDAPIVKAPAADWQDAPVVPGAKLSAKRQAAYDASDLAASKFTFGLSDKAAALGTAIGGTIRGAVTGAAGPGFGDRYDAALAAERGLREAYSDAHPTVNTATAPLALLAGGSAGTALSAVRAGVVSGTAAGAGQALGASNGSAGQQAGQVALGAGLGALTGGIAGRYAPALIHRTAGAARAAAGKVGQALGGRTGAAATSADGALQAALPAFTTSSADGGARTASKAKAYIADRLDADGTDPRALMDHMTAAKARGVPFAPMDSGPNMQRAAAAIARKSGPGSKIITDAVTARQLNQGERIQSAVARDLGPTASVRQASEDLITQAKSAAKPLYDEAYSGRVPMTEKLQTLIDTPAGRQALARARTIAANERVDPSELHLDIDADGKWIGVPSPTVKTLDYLKRGLDDVVESHRDPITGRLRLDEAGRAINDVRANFVSELRSASPVYGRALDAYAGPARMASALAKGSKVAGKSADDITAYMRDMTPAELEQFRLGARSALSNSVGDKVDAADRVRALIGTDNKRKALTQVFGGSEGLDNFLATLGHEAATSRTYARISGNSKTAENTLDDADLSHAAEAAKAAVHIAGGNPLPALKVAFSHLGDKISGEAGQRMRSQVAALIAETDPALAGEIVAAAAKKSADRVVYRRAAPVVGAAAGRAASDAANVLSGQGR